MPTSQQHSTPRYFVQRMKTDDAVSNHPYGRIGFCGPFRTEKAAQREADAWLGTGTWFAAILDATPAIRREVRDWQKANV